MPKVVFCAVACATLLGGGLRAAEQATTNATRFGIYRFAFPNTEAPVYYDAPAALDVGAKCELAVVLIHGWGSGGKVSVEMVPLFTALKEAVGPSVAAPYVIAPLFPRRKTLKVVGIPEDGRAIWNVSWERRELHQPGNPDDDWRGGGDAVGTHLSSFEIMDRLLLALGDRRHFPNLKRVVMTGFSAGGQFVGRYVAVGKGIVREGVTVEYAAMAPSTEFRFEPDVTWHYGLKGRPRYAAQVSDSQILKNLSSRRVWRGCGSADVLGAPKTALDSCPAAMAQGANRYERFRNFEVYLKRYPEWAKQVSFHTFEGVGHKTIIAHTDPVFLDFVLARPGHQ